MHAGRQLAAGPHVRAADGASCVVLEVAVHAYAVEAAHAGQATHVFASLVLAEADGAFPLLGRRRRIQRLHHGLCQQHGGRQARVFDGVVEGEQLLVGLAHWPLVTPVQCTRHVKLLIVPPVLAQRPAGDVVDIW